MPDVCPFCEKEATLEKGFCQVKITCPNCGEIPIEELTLQLALKEAKKDPFFLPKLRFVLNKAKENNPSILIDQAFFDRVSKSTLPTRYERIQNLILWLGNMLSVSVEAEIDIGHKVIASCIGAVDAKDVKGTIQIARNKGWVLGDDFRTIHEPTNSVFSTSLFSGLGSRTEGNKGLLLTVSGWEEYNRLTTKRIDSKLAFMAMSFNIPELRTLFTEYFKPAVKQTGFTLRDITEEAPAGHIDNRLIVEIRRSAFMVCDLTGDDKHLYGNAGAYWEAGFATGLKLDVIYTCEAGFFHNKERGTHFDTNHHHTILWDANNPQEAAQQLKATIRATLPDKATMSDDEL